MEDVLANVVMSEDKDEVMKKIQKGQFFFSMCRKLILKQVIFIN